MGWGAQRAVLVYRRLAEVRADLEHSVLYEWTVLLSKVVPGYDSSRKERMFVLFNVAVWHCLASVAVSDVVFGVTGHKVC